MRLFIAIDLPDFVKEYLHKLQALLPEADMFRVRDFHLTLKFLGECSEVLRTKVEEQLKQIRFEPFEAQLSKIGSFGGNYPRVLWIGISAPNIINEFVREIGTRMEKLGFQSENAFVPHVTLARIKSVKNSKIFLEALNQIEIQLLEFYVDKFYLFESKLSPRPSPPAMRGDSAKQLMRLKGATSKGAIYTRLAQFP